MNVKCAFFFFQAEDGIRGRTGTGVQTCALPISAGDEAQQAADQQVAPRGRAGLIGDVRGIEQTRLQALYAEPCRDKLRNDLSRLRVDLTRTLPAPSFGNDAADALVQARRQVGGTRQPQRLPDVLLDDAPVRKRLHCRSETSR